MELKLYLNIIYKRLWIIILFSVVAVSVSAYVSFNLVKPVYEANTTLFVTGNNVEKQSEVVYNDIMLGQQLVKDYRELIKSRAVTSSVIDGLKLKGLTPGGLAGKISVSSKNETRIIEIKVQDGDPKTARDIADKVSSVFISKVIEIMRVENVGVVDKAETPTSPIKPNKRMNIVIAFLVGIMAAAGLIFFIEYIDDTIKTDEDVERYLGLTVLGTIPVLSLE